MLNGSVLFQGATSAPLIPPGSWSIGLDSRFIVNAAAVIYAANAWSSGASITWALLNDATHKPSFFVSASGDVTQELVITYPLVKTIIYGGVMPDETLNEYITNCGVSVGTTTMRVIARSPALLALNLIGNGTAAPTKTGTASNAAFDFNAATGLYRVLDNSQTANGQRRNYTVPEGVCVQYQGVNDYSIRRQFTALGTYQVGFFVVDNATGLPVLTNLTTSDRVIVNFGNTNAQTNLNAYNGNNAIISSAASNLWAFGVFEAWIVVFKVGSGSLNVYYQTVWPSASSYKVYRDISSSFSSEVLVHAGNSGFFNDSGLVSGTVYYYRLKAVVAGVDVVVSYIWGQA